ncbi:MAG: hydroxyethylthiazole kinase [Clostridiales bacterium]|nr:hydroxyethylthiazole kinase [Clostridiales bacterium]MBE5811780.1 hydroxyethylthiazole kinase [Clostridiales bacterium]
MLGEIIQQTRHKRPLVHCITNYVSANDCANLLLGCGASAIMADDPEEVAEVTAMCNGLVLNMGIPNPRKLEALLIAGKEANRLGHPVVLDPVGVGSSAMRQEAARKLLEQVCFAAIRGNATEIATLVRGTAAHRGVDADEQNDATEANARQLARKTGAMVIVTGDTDLVTDGTTLYRVHNGHPMMRTVTGAGCQLSALVGAYITANAAQPMQAALAAVCAMGVCGEIAHRRLTPMDGNASYRNYILNAICNLTPLALEEGANYETDC